MLQLPISLDHQLILPSMSVFLVLSLTMPAFLVLSLTLITMSEQFFKSSPMTKLWCLNLIWGDAEKTAADSYHWLRLQWHRDGCCGCWAVGAAVQESLFKWHWCTLPESVEMNLGLNFVGSEYSFDHFLMTCGSISVCDFVNVSQSMHLTPFEWGQRHPPELLMKSASCNAMKPHVELYTAGFPCQPYSH